MPRAMSLNRCRACASPNKDQAAQSYRKDNRRLEGGSWEHDGREKRSTLGLMVAIYGTNKQKQNSKRFSPVGCRRNHAMRRMSALEGKQWWCGNAGAQRSQSQVLVWYWRVRVVVDMLDDAVTVFVTTETEELPDVGELVTTAGMVEEGEAVETFSGRFLHATLTERPSKPATL